MILAVIVGVITGVIASWVAWWVLFHAMGPKIGFSEKIKKQTTKNSNTGFYYQFKFANLKKHSSAVDISVRASLYLKDFPKEGVTNIYAIPVDGAYIFELISKDKGEGGWNRRISLKINDDELTSKLDKTYFPEHIKVLAKEEALKLEDLLGIVEGATLRVYVSAMDSFTGSRKVFRSHDYKINDVVLGKYIPSSLELVPEPDSSA